MAHDEGAAAPGLVMLRAMYAEFFGLSKDPFSIAPDPRFLFMSEKHREALAHLLYGVGGGGGFVLLTGEIGAGKTTVCRAFLEQIPKHCDVAYIFNPKLTVTELLQSVCEEFHIALPERAALAMAGPSTALAPGAGMPTVKDYVDTINRFLLAAHAAGRSAVLIIDEAQSLAPDVLEQLRLLTNLETHERKLLQIILIGQPELRDMLSSPGLEQLAQRVIARCHLGALTAGETVRYVQHRLAVAGGNGGTTVPFEPEAMSRLFQLTGGVPRRINLLAGRAMLGAYSQGNSQVDRQTVEQAAREVFDVRRGGGARAAAARAAGASGRPRGSSGGSGTSGSSRPTPLAAGSAAPGSMGSIGFGAGSVSSRGAWAGVRRPVWVVVAVVAGLAVVLGAGVYAWRDAWRGTGASSAAAPAGAGSAAITALATSGARASASASMPASSAAGASAASADATVGERFDDPEMLLAAAWPLEAPAWRALAMAWAAPLGEGDACGAAAAAAGLACFRTRGGLAAVRQRDRPGLALLRQRDERPVVALLVALDERGATLQTQGRHWRLSLAGLATVWRGEFATFWRTPPGWVEQAPGAGANALPARTRAWITERLTETAAGSPVAPLRERIWAFQVAHGLPPDGLAGPVTLMRLQRGAPGSGSEPLLSTVSGGERSPIPLVPPGAAGPSSAGSRSVTSPGAAVPTAPTAANGARPLLSAPPTVAGMTAAGPAAPVKDAADAAARAASKPER
jgi:general secretion pathway protein A